MYLNNDMQDFNLHEGLQKIFADLRENKVGCSIPLIVKNNLAWVAANHDEFVASPAALIERTVKVLEREVSDLQSSENTQPKFMEELFYFSDIFGTRIAFFGDDSTSTVTFLQRVAKINATAISCLVQPPDVKLAEINGKILFEIFENEQDPEINERREKLMNNINSARDTEINKIQGQMNPQMAAALSSPIPSQVQLFLEELSREGHLDSLLNWFCSDSQVQSIMQEMIGMEQQQTMEFQNPEKAMVAITTLQRIFFDRLAEVLNKHGSPQLSELWKNLQEDPSYSESVLSQHFQVYVLQNPQLMMKLMGSQLLPNAPLIQNLGTGESNGKSTADATDLIDAALAALDEDLMDEALDQIGQ